jgi:copper(I)-binding protein
MVASRVLVHGMALALVGLTLARPVAAADIQAASAWIRWLPAGVPGAGYVTLTNSGSTARVLIGASSVDYQEVSIHETRIQGGMTAMVPVDSIAMMPHSSLRLTEGRYHLMLMQPKRTLRPGDTVTIVLHFKDGLALEVPFMIRAGND